MFQLAVIVFSSARSFKDTISFVFKDISDGMLESHHLALNTPHDTFISMVMDIDNLLSSADVSDHSFCAAMSDFVQSLMALL